MNHNKIRRQLNVKYDDVLVWCYFVMGVIGSLAIYAGDTTLPGASLRGLLGVLTRSATLLALLLQIFLRKGNSLSAIILVPLMYFSVRNLNVYRDTGWDALIVVQLMGFLLLKNENKRRLFIYLKKYLVLMAALGILAYLAYILSLPVPYKMVDYYRLKGLAFYIDYGVSCIFYEGNQVRLCGLFNEPGYFGTILALFLCAEKLDYRRIENWILFVAGILTLSVAFVLILVFYCILLCSKRPVLMMLMAAGAIFYFFVLPEMTFESPQIAEFMSRFVLKDGAVVGDNRSNMFVDDALREMLRGNEFFFGYGGGYTYSHFSGILTYKVYLIDYGVVGFLLIYGSCFLAAILSTKRNPYAVFLCLCFFLSIYQRPTVFTMLYFVVLFGGIEHIKRKETDSGKAPKKGKAFRLRMKTIG